MKLNQVIAIEKGVKSRVYGELTNLNKMAQKSELFNGFYKQYQKLDEEGENLPPESKQVTIKSGSVMKRASDLLSELFDVTAKKDWANMEARADVVVDGVKLIEGAPVTFLLFLEKQLNDVHKLVSNLPELETSETWAEDKVNNLYQTAPTTTHRTKKVAKPIVLYDATADHPAQTQLISEDVLAGHWNLVKQSGALPYKKKVATLKRIQSLVDAIKESREAANAGTTITAPEIGASVFNYILEDMAE